MSDLAQYATGLLALSALAYVTFRLALFMMDEAPGDSIEADRLRRERCEARRAARKERRR